MSALHFFPLGDHRAHMATDGPLWFITEKRGLGWLGLVLDTRQQSLVLHKIDWTDHRVHLDEMKKALQSFADAATVGV